MSTELRLPVGTTEYVVATVTANVTLDTQTVEISLDNKTTWLPGTWEGSPGLTRKVRTTSAILFDTARSSASVYVRLTDSPEVPVIKAGTLRVS